MFTSRNPELAKTWLIKNKIQNDFEEVTNIKSPVEIYLDDRALKFEGNFNKTFEDIENFKVYWK